MNFSQPVSNASLLEYSVSNYPFERRYAQHHPSYAKPQTLSLDNHPVGLPERRGSQKVVRRTNVPLENVCLADTSVRDEHTQLHRRVLDAKTTQYETTLHDYCTQHDSLQFYAYISEKVLYSPVEDSRSRLFVFWYYPEDDTVRIYEPVEQNSGLVQGLFARRQQIVLDDHSRLSLDNLMIGSSFRLRGQNFRIFDANRRARDYVRLRLGIEMPSAQPIPRSLYTARRSNANATTGIKSFTIVADKNFQEDPSSGFYRRSSDTRRQFLEHYGEVLRFECTWDDTDRNYGDVHKLVLNYFLSDDTIEIFEPEHNNDGKFCFRTLLKRQKLPWSAAAILPFATSNPTAESLKIERARIGFQSPEDAALESQREHARTMSTRRYHQPDGEDRRGRTYDPITGRTLYSDNCNASVDSNTIVAAGDLICGELLRVYGRPLRLMHCDESTLAWYRNNLGIDQAKFFVQSYVEIAAVRRQLDIPPHFGLLAVGTEEETRRNANSLLPVPANGVDADTFNSCDGKVLRFSAAIENHVSARTEEPRKLVVNFFLADNTLSIFEHAAPNSGVQGGKFLERGKYKIVPPSSSEQTSMARLRAFGNSGWLYGYEHGYGQGYSGGLLGKADRTGPGCTGVAVANEPVLGRRNPQAPIPGRLIQLSDMRPGSRLRFAHCPTQDIILQTPDEFTSQFIQADSTSSDEALTDIQHLALVLSGVLESVLKVFTQTEGRKMGDQPLGLLNLTQCIEILAGYGACPPAIASDVVLRAVKSFTVNESEIPAEPVDAPAYGGYMTSDGKWVSSAERQANHARAQRIRSQVGLVRYTHMINALMHASGDLHSRLTFEQRLVKQLRAAVLSSVGHLRKVFRDLGVHQQGYITTGEFRWLLRRHHLDMGVDDAALLGLMRIFDEQAKSNSSTVCKDYCIPWRSFVNVLIDADNRSPEEISAFVAFVSGFQEDLKDGTGVAPQVFVHNFGNDIVPPPSAEKWYEPNATSPPRTNPTPVHDTSTGSADEISSPNSDHSSNRSSHEEYDASILNSIASFFKYRAAELKRTFELYDQRNTGLLKLDGFTAALSSAGFTLSRKEENDLFSILHSAGAINPSSNMVDYVAFYNSLWIDV